MNYRHTQRAPMWLIPAILGVASIVAAAAVQHHAPLMMILASFGALMIFISLGFQSLTIADAGDELTVTFGPLPMFRKRIPYSSITSAEPSHTALIDGWGIHWVPRRGWTWNLWGTRCVRLTVHGQTVRLGTDDPENLAAIIRSKIP